MRLAAINYDGSSGTLVDDVLAEAVRFLKRAGLNVAGAIQWNEPLPDRRRCSMTLEDLASGRRILASEDRGPHARGSASCHAWACNAVRSAQRAALASAGAKAS